MSEEKKKKNPDSFVTHSEFAPVMRDVDIIKLALFGSDMRGGIVKDIGDIKRTLKNLNAVNTYKIVKEMGVPIAVAVISAVITSLIIFGRGK